MPKKFSDFIRSSNAMYAVMGLHLLGVLLSLLGVENATNNEASAITAILNLLGAGFAYTLANLFQKSDPDA